jgi:CelD/BcsL family acetyltransferase involved in cellulose biosynthesis
MIVERVHDWSSLESVWDELVLGSRTASPFLTLEWLSSWWKVFGPGRELLLLASRAQAGQTPAAIAPLMLSREGGVRIIRFIGSGISDSLDFIVRRADAESVPAFLGFLLGGPPRWDLLWLGDFIAGEEVVRSVECAASDAGLMSRRVTTTRAPYLTVAGSWEAFLAGKSRHFRRISKQKEERLSRGDRAVGIERIRTSFGPETLSDMRTIESGSWKGRELAGTPERTRERGFLDRALEALAASGWLDLWLARVDGRPAAYQINFDFAGKSWIYNNAFDGSFAELSLGAVLMKRTVESAFRDGSRECDFLRGEEEFKGAWTGTARDVLQLILRGPGIRPRLAAAWANGALRNARRLGSKLRGFARRKTKRS